MHKIWLLCFLLYHHPFFLSVTWVAVFFLSPRKSQSKCEKNYFQQSLIFFLHKWNITYFLLYSFSYVVYCGLVFVALSQPYMMHQYGKDWGHKAPIRLCDRILYGVQGTKEQEVVILSQVGGFFAFMPFQYFFTFIDTVKNACFRFYALMVSVK